MHCIFSDGNIAAVIQSMGDGNLASREWYPGPPTLWLLGKKGKG